jgi:exosome complex component RRP45
LSINFGVEYGSVHVKLGKTRVLAQVTCEVAEPKSTRPNEGLLFINVEVGAMAAPNFESNRQSDTSVQINRILERALKDSRCIDLESLCIVSEEKVWNLRVDLNVLNHEGNIIGKFGRIWLQNPGLSSLSFIVDCASAAALAALAHFRRPDVSTSGEEVIIHTFQEKDPIPIVLHHYPVCVSYAIFNKGKIAVADPTCLEERVAEASLVFGINSYRELCGLHLGGTTLTSADLLLRSTTSAAKRAKFIVDLIKSSLAEDEELRARGEVVDFSKCIELDKLASYSVENLPIQLKRFQISKKGKKPVGQEEASEMDEASDAEVEQEEESKNGELSLPQM